MKLQRIARVLAIFTALCMLPIGAIPSMATETTITPAGDAFENPKMLFEEYFDGDATGWTGADSATFEDGTIKLTKGSTLGYVDAQFGTLNDKSFSFRFKTKVSGNTSETPNKNWVRPQLAFGSNQWIATYLGYNSNSVLTQETWYEFLYDYSPAATEDTSTGYQTATIYYRTSQDKATWSAWETATTIKETNAGGSTNSIKLYFGDVASNLATTVWYDDVQVYLHEEDTTPPPVTPEEPDTPDEPDEPQVPAGDPDGVDYEPNMVFEEYFDGDASKWSGADSATFEDGAIKLGKDSAISYADDKFGNLNDKSFTFRFKTKVSGNTSETPDKNWVRPELGFGSKQWIATYLGYNSDSVLKQDVWYEFLYDFEPATTENASTGYQSATIYYRTSTDKETWSAWQTAKTVTETEAGGSTNKIKLSFNFIASNQATIVWYDDIQVYIHEPKPVAPPVEPDTPDTPDEPDTPVEPEVPEENVENPSRIYWQEDFSDGVADKMSKPSDATNVMVVEDGMLHGTASETASSGIFYSDNGFGELSTKDFNFRFKAKVSETSNLSHIDVQTSFGTDTRLRMTIGHNNIDLLNETWYEFFYVHNYNESTQMQTIDIYHRYQTESGWTDWIVVATDKTSTSSSYDNGIRIYLPKAAANNAKATDVWLDDFVVYTGDIVVLDTPVIQENQVTVGGKFCIGTPKDSGESSTTMMAVVYDTLTETATAAEKEVFTMEKGSEVTKSKTFTMPALKSNEKIAVFAWDSLESGKPMAEVTGYSVPNYVAENAKPAEGQEIGITKLMDYNKVNLSGYVGKNGVVTASLTDETGKVYALLQVNANRYGMVDTNLILDSEQYPSDTYTLRVNYGGENNIEEEVALVCKDALTIIPVNSESGYEAFVKAYGSEADKALVADSVAVKANYDYFTILASKNDVSKFNTFRNCLKKSLSGKALLDAVSNAASKGEWYVVEELVQGEGSEFFQTSEEIFVGVKDRKAALLRMTGNYTTKAEFLSDLNNAIALQKTAEANAGTQGGDFGGGAGGGGNMAFPSGGGAAGGGGAAAVGGSAVPGGPDPSVWIELVDLESVPWAEKEIIALQKLDIINGAGDGNFYPNNTITREEFLKLALLAAGINVSGTEVAFKDVDPSGWYVDYVSTAYRMGIVNGVSETEFGIGAEITRADMAVMMDRILSACSISIEPTVPAFVFDDFQDIPDYATESISNLARMEIMNGVGGNTFQPKSSATRAEAAVLVYRIYQYMNERR